jgi:hypothetical protein
VSRFNPEGADVYVFADVTVDFFKTEITRGGEEISITPKEFKTLKFLARNAHRVISRDEFLDKAWKYENYPSTRTVDKPHAEASTETGERPFAPVAPSHSTRCGATSFALRRTAEKTIFWRITPSARIRTSNL